MNNELLENKTVFYVEQIRNVERGGFEFPVTFEVDPSNVCNLECGFCMFKDRDREAMLSWESYCWLLDELKSGGTKSITFTGGGEPLCNPRINSMIERALSMGFELGLVTNGVLLNRLERPEAFTFIRVSLDAGDAETYKNVKGRDKFDTVIFNIRNAIGHGAHVGLSFVKTKENEESLPVALDLAHELGVMYLQAKPDTRLPVDYGHGTPMLKDEKIIHMQRFAAHDNLPCKVAGLIGIVGADEKLYFCCQYRGDSSAVYGKLREKPLEQMLRSRMGCQPDITKCPRCRYMNYVKSYERLNEGGLLFFDHKNFL